MTPQQRSLDYWRQRGYLVSSVERRKRFPAPKSQPCRCCGSRQMVDIAVDLWNVFDLIAVLPFDNFVVFVQVTTSSNHADRRKKILASAEAKLCVSAGCRVLVQSWRKKDNRWQVNDEWITLEQFANGLPDTPTELYELHRKEKFPEVPKGSTLFQEQETF